MLKQVQEWLGNKKRNYSDGVTLFEQFASEGIKEKYLSFFEKEKASNPGVTSSAFTMLVNKISDIERNLLILQAHGKLQESTDVAKKVTGTADDKKQVVPTALDQIKPDELPDELKEVYDRLKEIRPLQAKYHADVKNAASQPAKRHTAALKLVELETERKELWDQIEKHLNPEVKEAILEEDNAFKRGFEAAEKVVRLKENIVNCKTTESNETKSDKVRANAKTKRKEYETELAAILSELAAE